MNSDLPVQIYKWEQKGRYITISENCGDVFVRQWGTKDAPAYKTLLLLHGFPESSYSYHRVIELLAPAFKRIVLFDFPGFGLSDKLKTYSYSLFDQADTTLTIWQNLGIKGGHLLAHDMGDSVTTELLARSEANLMPGWFSKGLQSITCTNGSMVMEKARLRVTQVLLRKPFIGPMITKLASYRLFHHQVCSASGASDLSEKDIESMWVLNKYKGGKLLMPKLISYLDERDRFQNTRWLPALAKTNLPVHLSWGAKDEVSRIDIARYLKENYCKQAVLTKLPDAGHFCQLEQPEKWADAILGFYESINH